MVRTGDEEVTIVSEVLKCPVRVLVSADTDEDTPVMMFFHGFPDTAEMWDRQAGHFTRQGFRCVRPTIPYFDGESSDNNTPNKWGYHVEEIAAMYAEVAEAVGVSEDKPAIVCMHDWGCIWGSAFQNNFPKLVRGVIMMDVDASMNYAPSWKAVPSMMVFGLLYSWWFGLFFVFNNVLPFNVSAEWFVRWVFGLDSDPGTKKHLKGCSITSEMCFPYWNTHVDFFKYLFLGERVKGRYVNKSDLKHFLKCPVLFLHGAKKGVSFHSKKFEARLERRTDGRVSEVNASHWLMDQHGVNQVIDWFLEDMDLTHAG